MFRLTKKKKKKEITHAHSIGAFAIPQNIWCREMSTLNKFSLSGEAHQWV